MEVFILKIKELNPTLEIKVDINGNIYLSDNFNDLKLPNDAFYDKKNSTIYTPIYGKIRIHSILEFPKGEKDYFSNMIFSNLTSKNIYELTKKSPAELIKKYLEFFAYNQDKLPIATMTSSLANQYYYLAKSEENFKNRSINMIEKNMLYQYLYSICKEKSYSPTSIQDGWESFQSWHINGSDRPPQNALAHRFYINIAPEKRHEFARKLLEKYESRNIPYYFKINTLNEFKDGIVIYTSTALLDKNIEVLRELENEMPELNQYAGQKHPLLFSLNKWLSYASEIVDGRSSYTDIISKCLGEAIKEAANEFVKSNPEFLINNEQIKNYCRKEQPLDEKVMKVREVLQIIISNPNWANHIINLVYKNLQKENIDLNNLYFDLTAKKQLIDYRLRQIEKERIELLKQNDVIKSNNLGINRGFISIALIDILNILFTIATIIMLSL